ncbi:MAG: Stk1 family PASTA domain-containing Ser/Thr kinase, partial [Actinomycetota bacterium]
MSISTDELYGNRYRVVGLLGTGGMARVYRARDELLNREVALKVLNERLSSDPSFVERFRREAQNAAGLNHPNIVALYDYGDKDDRYFIVMELIEGRSLSEVIDEDGALMPERAAEIARDTASGLGRAHESGIVHRDVKPHNIMITKTGQTKVTDFGIARAVGGDAEATMTQTGMVIGTAAYLSPEQAQGNPVDARSDVYSLGCVLHEMLTGDAPFAGDTPLAIAYKHVRENPERASEVNSDVPDALDAIVMKAMSKNPDNRYADANEMAEDLDRFLAGQRVDATPFLAATSVMGAGAGTRAMSEREAYEEYPEEEERKSNTGKYILITLLVLGLLALGAFLL